MFIIGGHSWVMDCHRFGFLRFIGFDDGFALFERALVEKTFVPRLVRLIRSESMLSGPVPEI